MRLELAPPSTAPPRRLVNASQANGLAWSVWRELDDFLFEVSPLKARADDPPTVALYASPADFSTAHKAERAAKAWCEAYVPPAAPEPSADREDHEVVRRAEVSGWLIEVTPSVRGGYNAGLIDLATGEVGPEQPDYESSELALDAASTWAGRNSTKAEQEDRRASAAMDAALAGDDMSTPFDGPGDITTELVLPPDLDAAPALAQLEAEDPEAAKVLADAVAARDAKLAPPAETPPAPSRDEELEQLRRELALARKERDAAISGVAADFREVTAEAEELLALAARRDLLIFELEDKKLELRSIEKKLAGKGGNVAQLVQGIARGDRSRTYQQSIPFASSSETREVVGALAQQQVAKLSPRAAAQGMTAKISVGDAPAPSLGAETWAFNGVVYTIEHQTTSNAGGACVTAWIHGHRDSTEGFGETLEQALGACKDTAAIVFADLAPGEVPAEGPPKPAKKAKGPKLKGHDQAAVLAAVARTDSTVAASIELGCSPFQLEKYAEKQGITLKLPAPPATKTSKSRGRKPKGGVQ